MIVPLKPLPLLRGRSLSGGWLLPWWGRRKSGTVGVSWKGAGPAGGHQWAESKLSAWPTVALQEKKRTLEADWLLVFQSSVAGGMRPTDLTDQLLLLGRVGHVLVDVSEKLLQGLLCVLLCWRQVLLIGRGGGASRPLQQGLGLTTSWRGASG